MIIIHSLDKASNLDNINLHNKNISNQDKIKIIIKNKKKIKKIIKKIY